MPFRKFLMLFALSGVILFHSSPLLAQAQSGFNVGALYTSPNEFDSQSDGEPWCRGWLDTFGISQDQYSQHCYIYRSSGTYGWYKYRGEFTYIRRDYPGNPQFYLIPY